MEWKIVHISETDSTNACIRQIDGWTDGPTVRRIETEGTGEGLAVVADYQTAGRGCGTNRWESERGKNLLFSMLLQPLAVPAASQFRISMAVSVAISEALDQYIGDVTIKWPNDIYWRNAKLCGILIEHTLQGATLKESIVGVGLNVNQRLFHSDAPNPVSLWQITGQETDRDALLSDILQRVGRLLQADVRDSYLQRLYRRKGYHPYADAQGAFMAEISGIEDDGHLVLRDDNGLERRYAFKEVQFII